MEEGADMVDKEAYQNFNNETLKAKNIDKKLVQKKKKSKKAVPVKKNGVKVKAKQEVFVEEMKNPVNIYNYNRNKYDQIKEEENDDDADLESPDMINKPDNSEVNSSGYKYSNEEKFQNGDHENPDMMNNSSNVQNDEEDQAEEVVIVDSDDKYRKERELGDDHMHYQNNLGNEDIHIMIDKQKMMNGHKEVQSRKNAAKYRYRPQSANNTGSNRPKSGYNIPKTNSRKMGSVATSNAGKSKTQRKIDKTDKTTKKYGFRNL